MKNIVLTGLPGCGKTTVGKMLAAELSREFFDLDEIIEKDAGMSIPEIFKNHGEAYFRAMETLAAKSAAGFKNAVISLGGGAVLSIEGMTALKRTGFVVFIDRAIDEIIKTMDTETRPLLKEGIERLYKLDTERRALYQRYADFTISGMLFPEDSVSMIKELINEGPETEFAIVGDPVAYSLSPRIHAAVFNRLGVDARYIPVQVVKGGIGRFCAQVRLQDVRGFNITMPHKQDVFEFLDEIDDGARACGAVNTVFNDNGCLCGYNTDIIGIKGALRREGVDFAGRRVLILGAGGAANTAAVCAALNNAASITLLCRNPEKADGVFERISSAKSDVPFRCGGLSPGEIKEAAKEADLLINATPLGMSGNPNNFENFDFLDALPKNAPVFDLIYSPRETRLLKEARARGFLGINGIGMLIYQALAGDEIFLSRNVNVDDLYDTVLSAIE